MLSSLSVSFPLNFNLLIFKLLFTLSYSHIRVLKVVSRELQPIPLTRTSGLIKNRSFDFSLLVFSQELIRRSTLATSRRSTSTGHSSLPPQKHQTNDPSLLARRKQRNHDPMLSTRPRPPRSGNAGLCRPHFVHSCVSDVR